MQQNPETYLSQLKKNRVIRGTIRQMLPILSLVVALGVFWNLKLTGITLAGEAFCGKVEHVHDTNCAVSELICTLEESEEHTHTDTCTAKTLTCGLGEQEVHTHTDSCIVQEAVCTLEEVEGHVHTDVCVAMALTCGLEEREAHTHTDSCITQEVVCMLEESEEHTHTDVCVAMALTCGMEEQEAHAHTDSCITQEVVCTLEETEGHAHDSSCYAETIACGIEEGTPHVHAEECYTTEQVCGYSLEESSGHTHTDTCYGIQISCQQEEHTHVETCYSDITADVETSAVWEQTLTGLEAAATTAERITATARSQLGYMESTLNFQVDENGIRRGYTRYGEWYGHPYGDWSAMFVSFCLHYAGVTEDMAPYNSGVEAMRLGWEEIGVYQTPDYIPEPGDILFLDKDANGSADAAAIVTECAEGTLNVIEGDLENTVAETTYQTTDASVMGYGSIQSILRRSLTEEDLARIESVNARIAALPTEEEVLAQMDSLDQESEEFQNWYYALCQEVKATNADYEALSADLRLFVTDTTKMDALAWTWQTAVLAEDTVASIDVYFVNWSNFDNENTANNVLTTIVYGGSPREAIGQTASRDYIGWEAYVIEKEADGFYVRSINRDTAADKRDIKPTTAEGFILLVNGKGRLPNVAVGQSVQITPHDFYKTKDSATDLDGTITFTTPKDNSANLTIVDSASTRDLITVDLFNYGADINTNWSSDHKYPGFQSSDGVTRESNNLWSMDFGNNITAEKTHQQVLNQGGDINKSNANGINYPISDAIHTDLMDGYPALKDGTSLDYLFSANTYATKANSENIDGLFRYDAETGKYSFDSRENAAVFNTADSTFTLYKQIMTPNFIVYPFGNFLPFNDIRTQTTQTTKIDQTWFQEVAASAQQKYYNGKGDGYLELYNVLNDFDSRMVNSKGTNWNYHDAVTEYFDYITELPEAPPEDDTLFSNMYAIDYDEPKDFFFGMSMHMDFIQPKEGLTGPDGKQPMEYTFAGDDDVWIYVDGKLFLDLSGIHRHVGGKIDFVNGKVYYYALLPGTGDVNTEPYKTVTFEEILGTTDGLNADGAFEDYSSHTFDFFYMERGSGSSVCRMEFNLPVIQKNSITVTKELEGIDGTEILGDPDFRFQVYRENRTELLIGPDVAYNILDQNGNVVGTGITDEDGVFTIKAGQSASFGNILESEGKYFVRELLDSEIFSQYDQVTVDGTASTINVYEDVLVGTDTFKGIDSTVKDMSDGSTSFLFRNRVDAQKYGSLEISKELLSYNEGDQDKAFTILLNIDGVPVPVGTSYTLTAADGTQTPGTVSSAGQLVLKHGQTARFDKVLAGSKIYAAEDSTSAQGYIVSYTGQNITLTEEENGGVSGMIAADATAHVKVTNALDGAQLPIEGTKVLLYPDGGEHTYTFVLQQITSQEDTSPVEGGTHQKRTVTLTENSKGFTFQLVYPPGTAVGTYYYLITEENAAADSGMDTSRYIAEVTLTEAEGVLTPSLTALYKNGSAVESLLFTNAVTRTLTVTKTVENPISADASFQFNITASVGDTPLTGSYPSTAPDGSASTITFESGNAVVYLKDGESITIRGLPYGAQWSVTEVNANGYLTKCGTEEIPMTSGSSISGTLTKDETVTFLNFGGAELPTTGSYARLAHTLGGWGIMLASLVYGFGSRRKRERRNR